LFQVFDGQGNRLDIVTELELKIEASNYEKYCRGIPCDPHSITSAMAARILRSAGYTVNCSIRK
jgi:hypothetical protein